MKNKIIKDNCINKKKGWKLSPKSIKKRTETRKRLHLEGKLMYPGTMNGRHHSKESKNKIRKSLMGHKVSKITRKKLSDVNTGKIYSEEYKARIRLYVPRGKNSHLWKGGITPLTKKIREGYKYIEWRAKCMARDNWTCQTCQKRGGELQVHHIISFSELLNRHNIKSVDDAIKCKDLWDLNNGITLCLECHKQTDSYLKQHNIHSQKNDMSVEDYKPLQTQGGRS